MAGLLVPEQLALLARLVVEMFDEVGIGFVRDAAIGFMRLLHSLGRAGLPGRATWGRIVPEPAVLENLPYNVALVGLDSGDDLHGSAAVGTAEGIGVVDLLDEQGTMGSERH